MMMQMEEFNSFANFCGCFHEDWPVDHASADDVLNFYVSMESTKEVSLANREITILLNRFPSEPELRAAVFGFGCSYDAEADGWAGCRQWLGHVRRVLSDAIGADG